MENQLAILLLIVPGYIARKIYKHTNDVRDDLSTFIHSVLSYDLQHFRQ